MKIRTQGPKTVGLILALATVLTAVPASADKIFVDYDHNVDFSRFKTFTYAPAKKGMLAQKEQIDGWIVAGIEERLAAGGLQVVDNDADPDLVVTYSLTTQTGERWDVTGLTPVATTWGGSWGWGPGFGAGWGYDGGVWYVPTTMSSSYVLGTLIIVAYDTETKLGVWRGSAEISPGKNPHKTHEKIDASLDKIAEKWHHMHKTQ